MVEAEAAEPLLQRVERRKQCGGLLRLQRRRELRTGGQLLQDEVRGAGRAQRVAPLHFAGEDAVGGQQVACQPAQTGRRALDAQQRLRGQRQKEQPAAAPPLDAGLGKAGRPAQPGEPLTVGDGACVGERCEGEVGREQRAGEVVECGCHRLIRF